MKRGKRNKLWMFFCALLAGITFQAEIAQAAESNWYDPDREGSITIELDDLGTERSGVGLACYQVGTVILNQGNMEGFQTSEAFASMKLDFDQLEDADQHKKMAESLVQFIKEDGSIQPVWRGRTDENGRVSCSPLEHGIYLIVQEDGFTTYGTIQPFLVGIPYMEDEILLYDVKTETKGEKPVPKQPQKDTPAKTGDTSRWGILLLMTGAAFMVVGMVARRKKETSEK